MSHDSAAQKAETFAAFNERSGEPLPPVADIDLYLVPEAEGADWVPLARALEEADFLCDWIDADDPENDGPCLIASLPDQPVSAQAVWIAEETVTRLALAHGFRPDGWALAG